jgi:hypothetical protein
MVMQSETYVMAWRFALAKMVGKPWALAGSSSSLCRLVIPFAGVQQKNRKKVLKKTA